MSLIKRFFGQKPSVAPVEFGAPRPAQTTYVVGDIHGRADLLGLLLAQIDADCANDPTAACVCLGDFIDRGDASAETLDILFDRQTRHPETFVCLMGNHEKMMLDFIDRTHSHGARWLRNGGLQTLASFGVTGVTQSTTQEHMMAAQQKFLNTIDPNLLDWVRGLPLQWESGNLIVVHAALNPNATPANQDNQSRIWGHRDFLSQPRHDGLWVAHGHTITDHPQSSQSRISLDTGAYYSGTLTAAKISPAGTVHFLQASR